MILRSPFLGRNVPEQAPLLLIVSAHALLDAASPSPVTAPATFSAACKDRPPQNRVVLSVAPTHPYAAARAMRLPRLFAMYPLASYQHTPPPGAATTGPARHPNSHCARAR